MSLFLPGNQLVRQRVMPVVAFSFVPFFASPLLSSFVLLNTQDPRDVIEAPRNYSIMVSIPYTIAGIHMGYLPSFLTHA